MRSAPYSFLTLAAIICHVYNYYTQNRWGDAHNYDLALNAALGADTCREMILTALHPGATVEQARANTGWDLKIAPQLRTTEPPAESELRILREELDPTGIYLK